MAKDVVSVIIPAFNEEGVIERNLKSLKKQTYNWVEAIVVDDGSTDNTVNLAKKYTDKVFEREHSERSVQRNFGASRAKGKYLFFLDADMELTEMVIEECVALVNAKDKIGAIAIPEIPVAISFWEKVKAHEREIYNLEGDEATDAARFFTKELFDKVGGYDENITGPEDWDLPERIKRLGYNIGRINAKIKHHERVPNPFKVAKKKYYYGLKSHRYMKKHGVSPVSSKTIYFLRPVFYKNWKLLAKKPILTLAMIFMLTLEQTSGGMGYIVGRINNL